MDIVEPKVRSAMMRAVRQANTAPERAMQGLLRAAGFKLRTNVRALPGRPDIVLPARKVAVFVHGCFWHRHAGCRRATTPSSNQAFWAQKFARNQARDRARAAELVSAGWRVLVVWECALLGSARVREQYLQQILQFIRKGNRTSQIPRHLHRARGNPGLPSRSAAG